MVVVVSQGEEVIETAYKCASTACMVGVVGAKLVLMDVGRHSFELDYERIASLITEKTKVIMPVDLGGVMCDYERIRSAVMSKQSLFVPANELQP